MAWTVGFVLLALVLVLAWALCLSSSRADDQIESWLRAEDPTDGTELDVSNVSPFVPRLDPDLRHELSATALPALWPDLQRRAAERKAELRAATEAREERRPHRPFWDGPSVA